jgi:hypothetical protein
MNPVCANTLFLNTIVCVVATRKLLHNSLIFYNGWEPEKIASVSILQTFVCALPVENTKRYLTLNASKNEKASFTILPCWPLRGGKESEACTAKSFISVYYTNISFEWSKTVMRGQFLLPPKIVIDIKK